jgi:hypothetical protein
MDAIKVDFFKIGCRLTGLSAYLTVLSARNEEYEEKVLSLKNRVEALKDNISSGFFLDTDLLNSVLNQFMDEMQELRNQIITGN